MRRFGGGTRLLLHTVRSPSLTCRSHTHYPYCDPRTHSFQIPSSSVASRPSPSTTRSNAPCCVWHSTASASTLRTQPSTPFPAGWPTGSATSSPAHSAAVANRNPSRPLTQPIHPHPTLHPSTRNPRPFPLINRHPYLTPAPPSTHRPRPPSQMGSNPPEQDDW